MEELILLEESREAREARDTPVGKTGQHRELGDRLLGSRMAYRPARDAQWLPKTPHCQIGQQKDCR